MKHIEDMTKQEYTDFWNTYKEKDILIEILKELQK